MHRESIIPGKAVISSNGNGLITIRMLPKSSIDLHTAALIVDHATELSDKQLHCNLVDIREMKYISSEAQQYFSKQNSTIVPAISILMDSRMQKSIINVYFRLTNPLIPTRAFNDEKEAIRWAKKKLNESKAFH